MKHVIGFASKIVFYVFLALVAFWTCSLTVSFVSKVLPGGSVEPYLALAVFDGGALTWLLVFLGYAKGLGQRAVALMMLVVDLLGVGVMCIAELLLGGQTFTTAPEGLGMIAVWVIGIVTFVNLASAYVFHVLDPAAHEAITIGVAQDRVRESGWRQLESKLEALGAELADELGEDLKNQALRDLGLKPRGVRQLGAGNESAIDAPTPPRTQTEQLNMGSRQPRTIYSRPLHLHKLNGKANHADEQALYNAEVEPSPLSLSKGEEK